MHNVEELEREAAGNNKSVDNYKSFKVRSKEVGASPDKGKNLKNKTCSGYGDGTDVVTAELEEAHEDVHADEEDIETAVEDSATPPVEPSQKQTGNGVHAGCSESTKTLEMNQLKEKAAKVLAELEQVKEQLQREKEKKRKEKSWNLLLLLLPLLPHPSVG